MNEARVNYRNESHNLVLADEAKLLQKLSWIQAALTSVSEDKLIETFVAAAGPLPPMAKPRVQPAFELLAENSRTVSLFVISFFAEDDGLLLRLDSAPANPPLSNLSPAEAASLGSLKARYSQGAEGFLLQPMGDDSESFLYAHPIEHGGRLVGLTALTVKYDELRDGMSPLIQEIQEPDSGLVISVHESKTSTPTIYSETIDVGDKWLAVAQRSDGDFHQRADVAKTRQGAVFHTILIVMGLVAAVSLAQRQSAKAASQAKSDFLANISHEVRAPLNGVVGMTTLALKTPVTPLQREYLQTASSSAECVLNLVNDLLDLSQVETGAFQLDPVEVSLEDLFRNTIRWFQEKAGEKSVDLRLEWSNTLPALVRVDPLRVKQVLTNLVSNAVKFTHDGEIVVRVEQTTDHLIRVSVQDTGIGILAEQLDRIFDPFQQAGGHIARSYGGTGLGLAICKQIVELLGGEIEVVSQPDKGSIFTFSFLAPEIKVSAQASQENRLGVLVVDDGPINRKLAKSILDGFGYGVQTAIDGVQALEILQRDTFDLVLLDLQMPEVDGFEVARTMRNRGDHTPIIAMTGSALSQDQKKCRTAGMNEHICKPIDERRLKAAIRRVVPSQTKDAVELEKRAVFDPLESLRRVGGEPRILERVIRLFEERYQGHIEELRRGRDCPQALTEAFRRIRSSVAPFAAGDLALVLAKAESGETTIVAIERELEKLKDALRDFVSEETIP